MKLSYAIVIDTFIDAGILLQTCSTYTAIEAFKLT